MAAERSKDADWSSRHVRLRFELMISAILIAAYALYDAVPGTTALLPIDLEKSGIETETIVGVLLVFYLVTLLHFYVRTRTELDAINSSSLSISEYIAEMKSAREALSVLICTEN